MPLSNIIAADAINQNDVLIGRGIKIDMHRGNVKFRQLVAMHRSTYQSLPATKSKWIRYSIMKLISEEIRNRGGRFLYEAFDCNGKCIGWTYADFPKLSRKIYNLLGKKSIITAKAKKFERTTSQPSADQEGAIE